MLYHNFNHHKERGQGLVEYALILVLIAVVVIAVLSLLGPSIQGVFCQIVAQLGGNAPAECQTDTVAITRSDYNSDDQELHLDATSDGSYDPTVTLTASPGGVMEERGGGDHYHIRFNLSGCPCTVTVTSSEGGVASVTVGP